MWQKALMAQTTFDPTYIGVGARALGMGKACVAAADEGDTIFTNPAGLGEIDYFKATSLSGKLLEEVNYTMLGGVYPLGQRSAFGLGYVGASLGGIILTNSSGVPLRESTYTSGAIIATYGKKITDELSLGFTLKYFMTDATNNDDSDGAGSNLDLGLLYDSGDWFSWGVVGQNLLSASKINYKNAISDKLPVLIKLGTKFGLTGQAISALIDSAIETTAYVDLDINLQGNLPMAGHLGLECAPEEFITLRAGLDQLPKPSGNESFPTGGISLNLAGLGFHYAYHPYGEGSESATHYFSITFDEHRWPLEEAPPDFPRACQPNSAVIE
jgi:hypothetical protein